MHGWDQTSWREREEYRVCICVCAYAYVCRSGGMDDDRITLQERLQEDLPEPVRLPWASFADPRGQQYTVKMHEHSGGDARQYLQK